MVGAWINYLKQALGRLILSPPATLTSFDITDHFPTDEIEITTHCAHRVYGSAKEPEPEYVMATNAALDSTD